MLPIIWYLVLTLVIVVCLDKLWKRKDFEKIPGPKGIFLFGNTLDFIMDPVKLFYYFRSLTNTYKHLFKLTMGPVRGIIIYNPQDIEALLSGTKYNTKGFVYNFIEPWLKTGLLISKGSKWHQRRKMLTPAFHFNILNNFKSVLEENCAKFVESLRDEVNQPKTDVTHFINDFTLHSICETAMGTKLDEETSSFAKMYKDGIYKLGQFAVYRAQRIWMYPPFIFKLTGVGQQQEKILEILRTFRDRVIEKRRKQFQSHNNKIETLDENDNITSKKRLAMLDLLLEAEKAGQIDEQGIREEVDTFMFGGHDTSANALQFCLMMLANHQDVQEKAFQECNEVIGSSDRTVTLADLSQMKYLECCIKETMRLYPPLPVITRRIDQPLQLRDYTLPAGAECAVLIFDLHRRNDQFVEPQAFRPERFMTEPTWHPYAFIPFSAGPRNCIGQKFAMIELKLALAALLRRYKLHPVTKPEDLIFVTDYVLRVKEPICVKFEDRK